MDLVWLEEEWLFGVGCMRAIFLCVCGVLSNVFFGCVVVGCVFGMIEGGACREGDESVC